MKAPAFDLPDPSEVVNLIVEGMGETTLQPGSIVFCINRGRRPLEITFDGNHLVIPVGKFKTEYRVALHAKAHLVVPGTRGPGGDHTPWISIIGSEDGRLAVDSPLDCEPFSDADLDLFGERIEALEPRPEIVPMSVRTARAMSRTQGIGAFGAEVREQASPIAHEAAEHVLDLPDSAQPRAMSEPDPDLPQPAPMRQRKRNA